jgi:hypothetical protein
MWGFGPGLATDEARCLRRYLSRERGNCRRRMGRYGQIDRLSTSQDQQKLADFNWPGLRLSAFRLYVAAFVGRNDSCLCVCADAGTTHNQSVHVLAVRGKHRNGGRPVPSRPDSARVSSSQAVKLIIRPEPPPRTCMDHYHDRYDMMYSLVQDITKERRRMLGFLAHMNRWIEGWIERSLEWISSRRA